MDANEWAKLYEEAGSMRELAKKVGMTHAGAAYHLAKHGIEVRNSRARTTPVRQIDEAETARWQQQYDEAGSVSELARRLGKDGGTIRYHLKRHGIQVKGAGYKSPKSVRRLGEANSNWKGGTYRHSDGYVMQYAPDHPDAPKCKGYVLQHRLVMERVLGRRLMPHEVVHHENEVKDDNRPENLELTDRSEHMVGHKDGSPRDERGRFSKEGV